MITKSIILVHPSVAAAFYTNAPPKCPTQELVAVNRMDEQRMRIWRSIIRRLRRSKYALWFGDMGREWEISDEVG
jgi:hypothetical protein